MILHDRSVVHFFIFPITLKQAVLPRSPEQLFANKSPFYYDSATQKSTREKWVPTDPSKSISIICGSYFYHGFRTKSTAHAAQCTYGWTRNLDGLCMCGILDGLATMALAGLTKNNQHQRSIRRCLSIISVVCTERTYQPNVCMMHSAMCPCLAYTRAAATLERQYLEC